MRLSLIAAALIPALASAQDRPNEADMFGSSDDAPLAVDAGVAAAPEEVSDGGVDRDRDQLNAGPVVSKFDTAEAVSDPLKIGGSLLMFGQGYFQEGRKFLEGAFSAPMILDVYLDGRPSDRLRAFVNGRLQFDPTYPTGDGASSTTTAAGATGTFVGLTPATRANPSVFLDQLWLRFDIARKVYLTIGRQKVRWGVSRIWYPTDFLNSRPRDALNPFDVRLGVNAVKVHVPIESLGWNFYAYGLLDGVDVSSTGLKLNQLGGALRGEFVLGPAEIGIAGVWQEGRRQRYALDISSAVGPIDLYAEAAFRDGQDFALFDFPADLTDENLLANIGNITSKASPRVVVQVSGGASFQFNYTDKNFAIVGVEYFYNPVGYESPIGYQVQTFAPSVLGKTLDPMQSVALYQGKHNLAITLASPGIPGFDWITVALSNIIIINDPAALTRLDVIFRVLNFLSVQAFGSVFYGQPGGQLRFKLSAQSINDIANLAEIGQPGAGAQIRTSLGPLRYPPLVQAGVLLRLAI
ncbi:MAG: hypothetical protein Q8L48_33140 [Archangium sp.]|nr:hypothetical protein [Archangium sp.]